MVLRDLLERDSGRFESWRASTFLSVSLCDMVVESKAQKDIDKRMRAWRFEPGSCGVKRHLLSDCGIFKISIFLKKISGLVQDRDKIGWLSGFNGIMKYIGRG